MKRIAFLSLLAVTLVRVGAAQAPAHTATHIRAAERLLELVDLEQVMAQGIDAMLKARIQQTPQLAPYEDIRRQFLEKHMSWAALKGDLITV